MRPNQQETADLVIFTEDCIQCIVQCIQLGKCQHTHRFWHYFQPKMFRSRFCSRVIYSILNVYINYSSFSVGPTKFVLFQTRMHFTKTYIFFLDRKETLNEILLRRPIKKPCLSAVGQNTCLLRGLVKGKLDF